MGGRGGASLLDSALSGSDRGGILSAHLGAGLQLLPGASIFVRDCAVYNLVLVGVRFKV